MAGEPIPDSLNQTVSKNLAFEVTVLENPAQP